MVGDVVSATVVNHMTTATAMVTTAVMGAAMVAAMMVTLRFGSGLERHKRRRRNRRKAEGSSQRVSKQFHVSIGLFLHQDRLCSLITGV